MEANTSDSSQLDSNVLLPPRKRLLACMKKQNNNGISNLPSNSTSTIDFDYNYNYNYNTRLNTLLSAHLHDENPSQEEIVEAARSAADVAVKIAVAARAAAQEKAVIATMAMSAAKKALELVAEIDEQDTSSSTELELKNKSKKRVEVQMLYDNKKSKVGENDKTSDEELARQLHQVINSSPRISKNDLKDYEHKRLNKIPNDDEDIINRNRNNGEEETSRKRGRMKQKKLPLSICHDRDELNPKEDQRWKKKMVSIGSSSSSANVNTNTSSSLWKCQSSFKSAARLKQNKV